MKHLKIIIGIVLALTICFLIPFNPSLYAQAEAMTGEAPPSTDWAYINRTLTNLSISSAGQATATAQLIGIPGVTTEVWIFMYLESYSNGSWTTVDSWYQSFNSYSGTLQESTYVTSGYWYRVKASYYAYSGSINEHVVQFSSSVYH